MRKKGKTRKKRKKNIEKNGKMEVKFIVRSLKKIGADTSPTSVRPKTLY